MLHQPCRHGCHAPSLKQRCLSLLRTSLTHSCASRKTSPWTAAHLSCQCLRISAASAAKEAGIAAERAAGSFQPYGELGAVGCGNHRPAKASVCGNGQWLTQPKRLCKVVVGGHHTALPPPPPHSEGWRQQPRRLRLLPTS